MHNCLVIQLYQAPYSAVMHCTHKHKIIVLFNYFDLASPSVESCSAMLSKEGVGLSQPALSPLISAPLLRPLVTHRLVKGKLARENSVGHFPHQFGTKYYQLGLKFPLVSPPPLLSPSNSGDLLAAIDEYDSLYPLLKAGELKVTVLVTWQDQAQASVNGDDEKV